MCSDFSFESATSSSNYEMSVLLLSVTTNHTYKLYRLRNIIR